MAAQSSGGDSNTKKPFRQLPRPVDEGSFVGKSRNHRNTAQSLAKILRIRALAFW
jgi:hypothetical protein